jgi:hypothetical protein
VRLFKANIGWWFFFISVFGAYGQSGQIIGKVIDSKTLEPLPFANIFINQTTLGTAADETGSFVLTDVPDGLNEVVVSFVGYQSYQTKVQIITGKGIQLNVRLAIDEKQLETVVVTGTRDKAWEKQLKNFEKVFFGNTQFAKACTILNPWVLEFKESKVNGKDFFTASAAQPLEIENTALGYRIDYYLKMMVSTSDGYNIMGEVRFKELPTNDPQVLKSYNQNRTQSYQGSLRHLMKALVTGSVKEEGFNLYTDKSGYENNPYRSAVFAAQLDKSIESFSIKDILTENNKEFSIQVKNRLEVHFTRARSNVKVYSDISYPVSWLQVNGGVLKVNAQGIVLNPGNLIVLGAMNDARVADLLPNNYSPEIMQNLEVTETVTPIQNKLKQLEEKVYIQTDKPYYYPGEKIWFKTYLNYRSSESMDSLSKVLYVEFIDPSKKIILSKSLFIDGGTSSGHFELPENLNKGTYGIRGYTNWMLNYNRDIAVMYLPVLGNYERPLSYEQDSLTQQGSEVKLISSKKAFNPREKIKLEFAIRNEDGTPRPAELSISVTDLNQVIDIGNNKNNILTEFDLQEWNSKDYLTTEINYAIETGITLVGTYRGKKGKPEKNTFNIVIGNFSDVKEVESDKQGNFKVTGLHFYDSTEIAFQSIGKAKKFEGSITWIDRVPPAIKEIKTEIKISTTTESTIQRAQLPKVGTESTILLKEVTVNEEVDMELNKENIPQVYAKADITISGDKIREASRTSLFTALRSQVPGLNVVNGYLRIGSASNFMGASSTEPLLILDGLQFTGGGGDSNYGRLQQINPEMVDRVDVIKYGSAAMYGTRGGNGVIIITTIKGEYGSSDRFTESNLAQKQKVLGYSKAGEFFSPDYSKSQSKNYRDTRSTILWVAQIRPDDVFGLATISFYAADLITTYKIVVEGVSDLGEPIHGVFYVNIQE